MQDNKPTYQELERQVQELLGKIERLEAHASKSRGIEEELIESRSHYDRLTENISIGVFSSTLDGRFIDVNSHIVRMAGYDSKEDFMSISAAELYAEIQDREDLIRELNAQGFVKDKEVLSVRKDKSVYWINMNVMLVTDDRGIPQSLFGTIEDLTEKKKAQEDALAHAERFRTFFSSVNDAIFVHPLQKEGFAQFIEVNDIACQRYGYTRDEFLKLTAGDITKAGDVKRHEKPEHRRMLREKGRMIFETVHIKKSGEEFPVEISSNIVEQFGQPVILAVVRDISERKKAEKALRASEEKIRAVLNATTDMIHLIDRDGVILEANEATKNTIGELVGKNIFDIMPPAAAEYRKSMLDTVFKTGKPVRHADEVGEYRVYNAHLYPVLDDHGDVVAAAVYARDITAQKKSEDRYKALIDTTDTGYLVLDEKGLVMDANAEYIRMSGHKKLEDIVGRSVVEWTADYDRDRNAREVEKCFRNGYVKNLKIDYVWKDGSITPIEINATVVRGADGTQILTLCRDITERQRAEKALRNEMLLSQQYLDSLPGLFYVFDEEKFVRWNSAWAPTTGYSDRELAQMYGPDFVDEGDKNLIAKRMGKVFREGFADAEALLVVKDGRRIPYYFTGLRKKINGRDYLVGLGIDISKRKEVEEELRKHREKLSELVEERTRELEETTEQLIHAQKMEAIGHLAGGIAHEFNNIIATISGTAEMLVRTTPPEADEHIKAQRILKSGRRAKDLTARLLTFARKEKLNVATVDMNELIRDVVDVMKGTIPKKVKIVYRLHQEPCHITVDVNQITQALLNICLNACDAMPDGGTLTLESGPLDFHHKPAERGDNRSERFCAVTISDTGTGINQDIRDKIFNPFFTTKERGKGSGLGLSVSHGIIEAHSGIIEMKSTGEGGTSFRIMIPSFASGNSGGAPSAGRIATSPVSGNLLIIDDDPEFLQMIQDVMEIEGFRVGVATSGKQGIAEYREHMDEIDIVLLDFIMPEMDAWDVFTVLKKVNPDVRVLIVSGYSEEGGIGELLSAGAKGFVQKPFAIDKLCDTIQEIIEA